MVAEVPLFYLLLTFGKQGHRQVCLHFIQEHCQMRKNTEGQCYSDPTWPWSVPKCGQRFLFKPSLLLLWCTRLTVMRLKTWSPSTSSKSFLSTGSRKAAALPKHASTTSWSHPRLLWWPRKTLLATSSMGSVRSLAWPIWKAPSFRQWWLCLPRTSSRCGQ